MRGYIEPLDAALWFKRVELIASGALGIENALRHAFHLVQLTPKPFRQIVRMAVGEDRFEALLEAGDFAAAARHLVTEPNTLTVQPGPGAAVEAVFSCAALQRAIVGTGESEAAAILSAWASRSLALRVVGSASRNMDVPGLESHLYS